jgi:hypothetical protein
MWRTESGWKTRLAHRLSWAASKGMEFPAREIVIAHKCDNPLCVRPSHLFRTDQLGNVRDMVHKQRGWWDRGHHNGRGEAHGSAKLKEGDVRSIRSMLLAGYAPRDIAAKFGASRSLVHEISAGRAWGWLP